MEKELIEQSFGCIRVNIWYISIIPYSAYILWVFNFANLESFVKFIQLKFELLRCHTHGQHEFVKFFQRIPSKQLFTKIYTREI